VAALALPYTLYTEGWSRNYLGMGYGFESPARYVGTLRAYLAAVHLYAWPFLLACPALLLGLAEGRWRRIGAFGVVAGVVVFVVAITARPSLASFGVLVGISLPAACAALFFILRRERRGEHGAFLRSGAGPIALCLALSVALYAGLAPTPYFRYLVGILPLFALVTAMTLEGLARGRASIVIVLVLALGLFDGIQRLPFFLGNALHRSIGSIDPATIARGMPQTWFYGREEPNRVAFVMLEQRHNRFPKDLWLVEYLDELVLDYDGPVEVAIRHLWANAGPDDVLVVRYEHFPFMFYTDITVFRWDEAGSLERLPDWIFMHGFYRGRLPERIRLGLDRYERVSLDGIENLWENAPEPHYHHFRTPTKGTPLKLLRLRPGESHELPTPSPEGSGSERRR
jgi:hypothetical protein